MSLKLYSLDEQFIKEVKFFPVDFTGIIEHDSGTKEWYENGKRHRDNDLPALTSHDHKQWWIKGHRHRINGSAVENVGGYQYYYINNKEVTKEQHAFLVDIMKLKGLL